MVPVQVEQQAGEVELLMDQENGVHMSTPAPGQ